MTDKMQTLDLDAIRETEGMDSVHVVHMNGRAWKFKARAKPDLFFDYLNMDADTDDTEALRIMDDLITKLLVSEHRADWAEARAADTDDADISLADMERIITWAMPLVSGRPLERRPDSSPGRPTGTTGPISADGSGSPEGTQTGLTRVG